MEKITTIKKVFHFLDIITLTIVMLCLLVTLALFGEIIVTQFYGIQYLDLPMIENENHNQLQWVLLMVSLMFDSISEMMFYFLAHRFFKTLDKNEVLFTQSGAKQLKQMGVLTIVLSFIIYLFAKMWVGINSLNHLFGIKLWYHLIIGVILYAVSLVFEYAAQE